MMHEKKNKRAWVRNMQTHALPTYSRCSLCSLSWCVLLSTRSIHPPTSTHNRIYIYRSHYNVYICTHTHTHTHTRYPYTQTIGDICMCTQIDTHLHVQPSHAHTHTHTHTDLITAIGGDNRLEECLRLHHVALFRCFQELRLFFGRRPGLERERECVCACVCVCWWRGNYHTYMYII